MKPSIMAMLGASALLLATVPASAQSADPYNGLSPTGIGNTPLPPGMTIGNQPVYSQQYMNVQNQTGRGFHYSPIGPNNPVPQPAPNNGGWNTTGGPYWNGRQLPPSDNYIFLGNGGYDGSTVIIGQNPYQSGGVYSTGGTTVTGPGYSYSSSTYAFGAPILTNTYGANCYPNPWGYQGLPQYMYCAPSAITVYTTPPQAIYVGGYVPYVVNQPQQPAYNVYNQYNTYNYYNNAPSTSNPTTSVQPNASTSPTNGQVQQGSNSGTLSKRTSEEQSIPTQSDADATVLAKAFQDIARCWMRSDTNLLKKYMMLGQKISVQAKGVYQYSIDTEQFAKVTDNVFDQIATRSFTFDVLRAQTGGDITAYGKHVYILRSATEQDAYKTMYVSYTLGKRSGNWVIVAVDSSSTPLVQAQVTTSGASTSRTYTNFSR